MSDSQIQSVKDVAVRLKITEQSVRSLIRDDKLRASRIGKQWVIYKTDVESYIDNNNILIEPDDHPRRGEEIPKVVALSFFSGAMGLDLGMEKAGIKPLLACEFEKSCRKTIESNRPEIGLIGDICKYSAKDVRRMANLPDDVDIDVIFGGPPCQAFSTAGNRKGFEDNRGNVFLRYLELISELQPKYAVIENVRGLLSAPYYIDPSNPKSEYVKGGALLHAIDYLNARGYATSFNLYNAANYGAPQVRERIVIIGSRDGKKPSYLTPTNSENGEYGLPKWKTLGESLAGLDTTNLHHIDFPEERLKYYRMLKPGQYWKNLPPGIQKEAMGKSYDLPGGKTGFYRRLSFDKPSPTLVTTPTMPATDLAHPLEDRPLSVEEYRRIQGFPDDWIICGNIHDQYKQIGNAVPISLGEAIGKTILNEMNMVKTKPLPNFKYSRYKNTNEQTWIEETFPDMARLRLSNGQSRLPI